ncbi:MAG TPA: hypothetical protein VF193_04895 [Steroidobacter sp.]
MAGTDLAGRATPRETDELVIAPKSNETRSQTVARSEGCASVFRKKRQLTRTLPIGPNRARLQVANAGAESKASA